MAAKKFVINISLFISSKIPNKPAHDNVNPWKARYRAQRVRKIQQHKGPMQILTLLKEASREGKIFLE
jgi:hypothetical protein